jgi:hypothetical protein
MSSSSFLLGKAMRPGTKFQAEFFFAFFSPGTEYYWLDLVFRDCNLGAGGAH